MYRQLLLCLGFVLAMMPAIGQGLDNSLYRTYTGEHNNLSNPSWGAAHTPLLQLTPLGFADGYQLPGGIYRPNPRDVSNRIFAQGSLVDDVMGLSDFCWGWGQFLDHDIGLTPDGDDMATIRVPAGDPHFDPFGLGRAIIPMRRSAIMAGTGTDVSTPREFPNEITAFIDGSGVYGSDEERADWLRTFEGGKLKVSSGNLLPFNTYSGEFQDEIDPDAPFMDNATGISDIGFVAGDPRASENPILTSFHTLFLREHNRQCDLLADLHPDWNDEEIYQYARKIIGGLIASIVYDEWLPVMGVTLPDYAGYNPRVNPQLSNVFTAAAFRLGHTLLSSTILRIDNDGNVIQAGNLGLRDAFFNPFTVFETGSIDPFLKGMAVQKQQQFDNQLIDDVRNFLFGLPGVGGLDLAAININRGRERGLPDFNTVRDAFGLDRYLFFQQINSNPTTFNNLMVTYQDIEDIDPWVGMLSEKPLPGSLFGETLLAILEQQFTALRAGDRFYYEIDPVLSDEHKQYIHQTTMRDIVMYNTNINLMQNNAFGALPHRNICNVMTLNVAGQVRSVDGTPLNEVTMNLVATDGIDVSETGADGQFVFSGMPFCDLSALIPERDFDHNNGVSTFDIIEIQKHILGVELLESPYQHIAADVNKSGSITTIDIIQIRKLILNIDERFTNNTSWRFVLGSFDFPENIDPLSTSFPEFLDFSTENAANYASGFIAIKVGDVNNSAEWLSPSTDNLVASRNTAPGLSLSYTDHMLVAGEVTPVEISLETEALLAGWQFELAHTAEVEFLDVAASEDLEPYLHMWEESLRMSFHEESSSGVSMSITLFMKANADVQLSNVLHFGPDLHSESYGLSGEGLAVNLISSQDDDMNLKMEMLQAEPNPFSIATTISFYAPATEQVRWELLGADGKILLTKVIAAEVGMNSFTLRADEVPVQGYFAHRLWVGNKPISGRLIYQQ